MYIDTHAHVLSNFYANVDEVLTNAKEAAVHKIINVGTNIAEDKEILSLCKMHPNFLYPAIGIHPDQTFSKTKDMLVRELDALKSLCIQNPGIVAIGECGLDLKEKFENKEEVLGNQLYLLKEQCDIASSLHLPVIIHCRQALPSLIEFLNTYPQKLTGVLHSVEGDKANILQILRKGLYVSFNGIATFKNAAAISQLAIDIPIEHIILETDSPFLSPTPLRGTMNEPSHITYVYQYLASIKGKSVQDIEKIMEENTQRLFNI